MNKETFSHIHVGKLFHKTTFTQYQYSRQILQDVIDYEEQTPQILEKITLHIHDLNASILKNIITKYIKEKNSCNEA